MTPITLTRDDRGHIVMTNYGGQRYSFRKIETCLDYVRIALEAQEDTIRELREHPEIFCEDCRTITTALP